MQYKIWSYGRWVVSKLLKFTSSYRNILLGEIGDIETMFKIKCDVYANASLKIRYIEKFGLQHCSGVM